MRIVLRYMATVLITGGTGLIGTALTKALLQKRHRVIILSRSKPEHPQPGVQYATWNVEAQTLDVAALQQSDFIIHLAGANVAEGRWTEKRKQEIINSRVQSGALLVKALRENNNKIQAVIAASAIGWYGPDPIIPNPNPFIETDPPAADFLGTTCVQWEQSLQPLQELGKRIVSLRTGIVLSTEAGAYAAFKKPLRFGIAGILGTGKQIISWIHIDDIVNLYITALEKGIWNGVYNAVAPQPVSNETLIKKIRHAHGGFSITARVPELALKTALGEISTEVLKSTTVSSEKIAAAGYHFLFPTIDSAVQNLEGKSA